MVEKEEEERWVQIVRQKLLLLLLLLLPLLVVLIILVVLVILVVLLNTRNVSLFLCGCFARG